MTTPQSKSERRARRALRSFARFVYTTINGHARRIDQLSVQVALLNDRLLELRDRVTQLELEQEPRNLGD